MIKTMLLQVATMRYLLLTMLLLAGIHSWAQPGPIRAYSVGDTLPEIPVSGFMDNAGSGQVPLSDFYSGRLLLLDFWATWCKPCIPGLEELSGFKEEFSGQLEVIGLTYQPDTVVDAFRERTGRLGDLSFPLVAGDTLLTGRIFPYKSLPHVIWIDSAGVVIAITDKTEVTRGNIERALAGTLQVVSKVDQRDFNPEDTFHGMDSLFLGCSILTPHFAGVSGRTVFFPKGFMPDSVNRFLATNIPPYLLFRMAAFGYSVAFGNDSRMVFEVKDSTRFLTPKQSPESFKRRYDSYNQWRREHTYCYELDLPRKVPAAQFSKYMINDLNRYFNVHARFEKRLIDCWVLKIRDGDQRIHKLRIKTSSQEHHVIYKSGIFEEMYGEPINTLVNGLNKMIPNGHIVNDTGIDYLVTIRLGTITDRGSISELNRELSNYGLELKPEKREVDVFVVTELE